MQAFLDIFDIYLLEAVVNGILLGGVLALLALGLNLIFGVIDVTWICYAELVMIGMYGMYYLVQYYGLPYYAAAPLTILLVGSAIILFKLTIPPRLGLSMELSVGFMLILLGALTLTGAMQRVMDWVALRGVGGEHSHWLFGERMVHSHNENEEANSGEPFSLPGWTVVEDEDSAGREEEVVFAGINASGAGAALKSINMEAAPVEKKKKKLSLFHVLRPPRCCTRPRPCPRRAGRSPSPAGPAGR